MKEKLASFWKWLTTSRYTSSLEAERVRLLQDNKDLMNALLAASNLPMLPSHEPRGPLPVVKPRLLPSQYRAKLERFTQDKHEGKQ